MGTIQHWIAGSETTGTSTRFSPVYNPATGEQQAQVTLATAADVDAALQAAAKAFDYQEHHRAHMHSPTAT